MIYELITLNAPALLGILCIVATLIIVFTYDHASPLLVEGQDVSPKGNVIVPIDDDEPVDAVILDEWPNISYDTSEIAFNAWFVAHSSELIRDWAGCETNLALADWCRREFDSNARQLEQINALP